MFNFNICYENKRQWCMFCMLGLQVISLSVLINKQLHPHLVAMAALHQTDEPMSSPNLKWSSCV